MSSAGLVAPGSNDGRDRVRDAVEQLFRPRVHTSRPLSTMLVQLTNDTKLAESAPVVAVVGRPKGKVLHSIGCKGAAVATAMFGSATTTSSSAIGLNVIEALYLLHIGVITLAREGDSCTHPNEVVGGEGESRPVAGEELGVADHVTAVLRAHVVLTRPSSVEGDLSNEHVLRVLQAYSWIREEYQGVRVAVEALARQDVLVSYSAETGPTGGLPEGCDGRLVFALPLCTDSDGSKATELRVTKTRRIRVLVCPAHYQPRQGTSGCPRSSFSNYVVERVFQNCDLVLVVDGYVVAPIWVAPVRTT